MIFQKHVKGKILLSKEKVALARDKEGNHGTSTFNMTLEIDMVMIDKNENNTCMTIYEAIHETFSDKLDYLLLSFLNCVIEIQMCHIIFHIISK